MAYSHVQELTRSKVLQAAARYGINPKLALGLVGVESSYGANTGPSSAGARGPMQIMPTTAPDIARDHNRQYGTQWTAQQVLDDDNTNIAAGLYYLKQGLDQKGSTEAALFRYNPSRQYVRDVLERSGSETPTVTQQQQYPSPVATAGAAAMATLPQLTSMIPPAAPPTAFHPAGGQFQTGLPLQPIPDLPARQMPQAPPQMPSETGSIGFWPYALSILSALGGQVGPLMGIMEQERRTKILQAVAPGIDRMNQLRSAGKYDEAMHVGNSLLSGVARTSPELTQHVMSQINDMRGVVDTLKQGIESYNLKIKDMPEGDLRRPQFEYARQLLTPGQATPGGAAAALQFLKESGVTTAQVAGGVQQVTPGGQVRIVPTESLITKEALGNEIQRNLLTRDTGLTEDEQVNLLKGLPVMKNGVNITNPHTQGMMKSLIAQHAGTAAALGIGAQVPTSPEAALTAAGRGASPTAIATREAFTGQGQPGQTPQTFYEDYVRMKETLPQAQYEAKMRQTGMGLLEQPTVYRRSDGRMMDNMAAIQVRDSAELQKDYVVRERKINPELQALGALKEKVDILRTYLKDTYKADLPSLDDPIGRVQNLVARTVHDAIPYDPSLSARQTAEALAHTEIEEYINRRAKGRDDMKRAQAGLLGKGATRESMAAQLDILYRAVAADYKRIMETNDISGVLLPYSDAGATPTPPIPADIATPQPGSFGRLPTKR